jgi:TolB protein
MARAGGLALLLATAAVVALSRADAAGPPVPAVAFVGANAVYVADASGRNPRRVVVGAIPGGTISWSPDGQRIAFTAGRSRRPGGSADSIAVVGLDGTGLRRLGLGDDPAWSLDGSLIAYDSNRGDPTGYRQIYIIAPAGGHIRALTTMQQSSGYPTWSPDGRRLAFDSRVDGTHYGIYVVNVDGSGLTLVRKVPAFGCACPAWSSDGRSIAYEGGTANGRSDIYVMNVDGSAPRRLTRHPARDENPDWAPTERRSSSRASVSATPSSTS